jgi:hypothetical protein
MTVEALMDLRKRVDETLHKRRATGRGARPRWLVAAIKGGKKLEDFLIDKSARKGRKKRRLKRALG